MTIHNIEEFADYLGTTVERLEHDIYKYTDCGAWIQWDAKKILIGSIVEGSEAEFTCDPLVFPFDSQEYDDAIEWLEHECDFEWHRVNYDEKELRMFIDTIYAYEEKPTEPYTLEDAEKELSAHIENEDMWEDVLDLTLCDPEDYMNAINYLIENIWH